MSKCVIVASYDPEIRKRQKGLFKGLAVQIHAVGNGEDALKSAATRKPDLMLIDPMLPKVSGFEVSRMVREARPDLPIIMLTSVYRGLVYRTEALHRYGATEYFEEPVDQGQFREAIRQHLGLSNERDRTVAGKAEVKKGPRKSTRRRLEAILQETGARNSRS